MPLSQYKAVFFDVGGTLLKVHPSVGEVYATEAAGFGFTGSAEALDVGFRTQWKAMGGIESLDGKSGLAVEKQFWKAMVRNVFEPLGGVENFDRYFERVYQRFMEKESWHVYEDVLTSDILAKLKSRGVVLGVISNWDSRLPQTLENLNLAQYFDFILASTVVGWAKPNPKIFVEGLKRSGIAPEEACHIGDEPNTDIKGAMQSGVAAVLIDREDRHKEGEATFKVRSFMELV